jgi:hypothetical protein
MLLPHQVERALVINASVLATLVVGLSEPEIAEVTDAMPAHGPGAGTPPEADFGTAGEYAKQFPKKERRTWGTISTTIGTPAGTASSGPARSGCSAIVPVPVRGHFQIRG